MNERREVSAGGVVYRRVEGGIEVAIAEQRDRITHRTTTRLPKGKIDPGESTAEAAVREVAEEIGLRARVVTALGSVEYDYAEGSEQVSKEVHYFLMEWEPGEPLELDGEIRQIAQKYFHSTNFLFLGRGIMYPIALEGALKLKEISYIHAEGYAAGEMKHGPIALIDEDMPVVVIANRGFLYEKVISNLEQVRSREGRVIAIATEGDEEIADKASDVIYIPDLGEYLTSVIAVLPLQMLAYHIAVLKGTDIDQPRNLAKSVTVE